MILWFQHHPCPEPACEDGEITVEYRVGQKGRFIRTDDVLTCSHGHPVSPIPQTVLATWQEQDRQEYQERQWARWRGEEVWQ